MGAKKKRSDVTSTLGDDAASSPKATSDPDYFPSNSTKATGPSRLPPPPRTRARAQPKSRSNPETRRENSQTKEYRQRRSNTQHSRHVTPANPPRLSGNDAASSQEATSDPKDPDYFPLHATKAAGPSRPPLTPRTRARTKTKAHRQRQRQRNTQHSRDVEEDKSLQEVDSTAVVEIDRMTILATAAASL